MHLKLFLSSIFCCLLSTTQAQFENSFDNLTYIVRWETNASLAMKNDYLDNYRSKILCEMSFDDREYAWLEFEGTFPYTVPGDINQLSDISNLIDSININGGVIGSQDPPVVDGSSLDYMTNHTSSIQNQAESCFFDFDFTMPFGANPVKLYNLDTGVRLPIEDSSDPSQELDFSGTINCLENYPLWQPTCMDENGHGTHGAGIQLAIFNKSVADFGVANSVDIISYRVFDDNGVGNLGAILCALSDIYHDPCERKVVNCSFSFIGNISPSAFDPLEQAFYAMGMDSIFSVLAAGNDATQIVSNNLNTFMPFPLGYFSNGLTPVQVAFSTIGIGGATCNFMPGLYSNYSSEFVDISTLGTIPGPDLVTGIEYYEGTSQATFASSAVAAMLMSHQTEVDVVELKCSMMRGAIYNSDFQEYNSASGILSASASLLLLKSGCISPEPCQAINVVTGNIQNGGYKSGGELYSNGSVLSDEVLFSAESSITLMPGFQAKPTIQFHAFIEMCN